MISTENIKDFFRSNNYHMVRSVTEFYFLMKGRKVVWMDAACEDAYDLESAMHVAYSIIKESGA